MTFTTDARLSAVLRAWATSPSGSSLTDARETAAPLVDVAVAPGGRPPIVAILADALVQPDATSPNAAHRTKRPPILVISATTREAEDLTQALGCYLGPNAVATFPSWETLPHERLSPRSDTVGRRLAVLRRLTHPDPQDPAYGPLLVVVTPIRAALQPIVKGLGDLAPVALKAGDERPLDQVVEALANAAYTRADLVERRGDFAVRGGILDVFPPTEEHPLRVEFWGDTVEEIRWFKVADQRSLEIAEHGLWAPPCRELLLTPQVRERAHELAPQLPGVADLLGKVAEGIAAEGMESLSPALADGMETLLDVLPQGTLVVVNEPERVRTRAHDVVATSHEFLEASWLAAAAGKDVPIDLQTQLGTASHWTLAQLRDHARSLGMPWWSLTAYRTDTELTENSDDETEHIDLGTSDVPAFRGDTEAAVAAFKSWVNDGWTVLVVTEGPGLAKRVREILADHDLAAARDADTLEPGRVHLAIGSLGRGFLHESEKLAVVTELDLTGQPGQGSSTRDMRRMPSRRRNQVDPLALRGGDYVVHEQHGVGRFVEMVQRTVGGATREYLVIEYAASKRGQPADRLYVPTDQLDQVTKYVGGEAPTINRLGGSDWHKTKARARRYVKQIAADLIRLYSSRCHGVSGAKAWPVVAIRAL